MKKSFSALSFIIFGLVSLHSAAQTDEGPGKNNKKLFIDVHQVGPGNVKFKDVAAAHAKDLAVEKKHGVHFIKYWVDEGEGHIYCLSSAGDTAAIREAHSEAHGLIPAYTLEVTEGSAAAIKGNQQLFLDIHKPGPGNVTAAAVEGAHKKDLAVQGKYNVNFINYWVDTKAGVILCLSEAKNAASVTGAHKEAHGLIPAEIRKVKQGQ